MACLIVPAVTAVVTSGMEKKVPEKYHLNWLNSMLWGGSLMLAVEHVAHQEIVPYPPFLSAMSNPVDTAAMLKEIATVGTVMTLATIVVWATIVMLVNLGEKTQRNSMQRA